MTKEQLAVKVWMLYAGQACPLKPQLVADAVVDLRERLISEESNELRVATRTGDIIEIADALGDLLYVVLGAANAYGIDLEPIFWEIQRSNLSKFIDGHRREDGKWIKGPSHSPANLRPIIEAQQQG